MTSGTTYAQWAGPRPAHDPFDWLVVDVNGKFVGGSCGGYSPNYYAPLHRYRACTDHPDWAEWHRRLIRMVAEVGYDGCFVDNCHPDNCYCRHCEGRLREFLKKSRDVAWVRRLTEGLDIDKLELDSPDVPGELVRRYRLLRTGDHLAMLRRVGREVKPGFTIFPNGNSIRECLTTGGQCDRLMFESTYSPGILAVDRPPSSDAITIAVADRAVEPKRITHRYEVADPNTRIELEADVSLPSNARVGEPVQIEVRVVTVGVSDGDNDTADDFLLLLKEAKSGEEVRLPWSLPSPSERQGRRAKENGRRRRSGSPGNPRGRARISSTWGFITSTAARPTRTWPGWPGTSWSAAIGEAPVCPAHARPEYLPRIRGDAVGQGERPGAGAGRRWRPSAAAAVSRRRGSRKRSTGDSSSPIQNFSTAGGKRRRPPSSTPTGAATRSRMSAPTDSPRSTIIWPRPTGRWWRWSTRVCPRRPMSWPTFGRSISGRRPTRCRPHRWRRFATGSPGAAASCWPARQSR